MTVFINILIAILLTLGILIGGQVVCFLFILIAIKREELSLQDELKSNMISPLQSVMYENKIGEN